MRSIAGFEVLNRFNEVLRVIRCNPDKCGVGLLRGDNCTSICRKRKERKERMFSFDQHLGFEKLNCLRCGDGHYVRDCPTRSNRSSGICFAAGVCGRCGFYRFVEGHGARVGENDGIFRHDLSKAQLLEKSWRESDGCGSGLCDLLYPCLFYLYKSKRGR